MNDPIKTIWEFLTEIGTDLYSLIASRAWCPEASPTWTNASPSVVYELVDDGEHGASADRTVLVAFRCYGGSAKTADARRTYDAMIDRFRACEGWTGTNGTILTAQRVSGIVGGREDGTEWPVCGATYLVTVSA